MDNSYLSALDEYFCARYSDYTRLCAIEGYRVPDLIKIDRDGNVSRKNNELMRLDRQENRDTLLQTFKQGLANTDFTFHFSFPSFIERLKDRFRKYTFAKLLPVVLSRSEETPESAGSKLDIDAKIWKGIVKGKLYPEKNTVLAIALTCRISAKDTAALLGVCGFSLDETSVRDVVADYLLTQKIYNEEMRDRALAEYKITCLPIRRQNREDMTDEGEG